MAKIDSCSGGYECEFVDSVPSDFFCFKCSLVPRRLTITSCCSETFCHGCIEDSQACPVCGEKDFLVIQQMKYQKRVKELHVYCSMKEKGCEWSGPLEQLGTHLDPDQGNCQYMETKCPLHCHKAIPKNKLEQHVRNECMKREHVCQHCNLKATYEEMVASHFSECKYVPLQCPNRCGVTFERDFLEDHMKMCRLEEVACVFSCVGCEDRFTRENEEEHSSENSYRHLTLTASAVMETNELLRHKLLEQEERYRAEMTKLRTEMQDQQKQHAAMLKTLEEKMLDQQQQVERQLGIKLKELEERVQKLLRSELNQTETKLSAVSSMVGLQRTFTMKNFSLEKTRNKVDDWMSPAMYTHGNGYRFHIGVDANGYGNGRGQAVCVSVWSCPGDFDDQLSWPASVEITIELRHQCDGENVTSTLSISWEKPKHSKKKWIAAFPRLNFAGNYHFIKHSEVKSFLANDTLYFDITKIVMF